MQVGSARVALDALELARYPGLERRGDGAVVVGIRPESFLPPTARADDRERVVDGVVVVRESLGSDVFVRFRAPGVERFESSSSRLGLGDDDDDQIEVPAEDSAISIARLPATSTVTRDESIMLAIAPGAIRLFDPDTGVALASPEPRSSKEAGHATHVR